MTDPDDMIRRQRALADFADFVLDHEDLDAILDEACRLVAGALRADLACVIEVEPGTDAGLVRAGVGCRPGVVGRERLRLADHPLFLAGHGLAPLADAEILLPGRRPWGRLQAAALAPAPPDAGTAQFLATLSVMLGAVIDRHRVAAEREQARLGLSERDERLRRVLDGMGEAFGLIAPDFTIVEYNREAVRLDGRPREAVVGRSHWQAFPATEDSEVGRLLQKAMAERIPVSLEHRYPQREGGRWLEMRAYPTADGCLAMFWRDVTDRHEAEAALRRSEGRFRAVATAGPHLVFRMSPDWLVMLEMSGQGFVADVYEPLAGWAEKFIPPEDQPLIFAAIDRAVRERSVFDLEHRAISIDGEIGWAHSRAVPLAGADGEIVEWFGVSNDVSARKRAEMALRESEARLAAAFESVPAGLAVIDTSGKAVLANTEYRRFLPSGVIPSRDPERGGLWRSWDAEGRPLPRDQFPGSRALRGEHVTPGQEMLYTDEEGREVWTNVAMAPVFDDAGRVTGAITVISDITQRRKAEERQQVLVAELQHRTRNLITVVGALARRTLGESDTLADFEPRFAARLEALSRVQGLLSRLSAGARVTFDELLRSELSALGAPAERLTLDGPPGVELRSSSVQIFALALHELGTNAVKYGAFAGAGGALTVRWSVSGEGEDRRLLVEWRERGADMRGADGPPRGGGYGRELIERSLPYQLGAETTYDLTADGVCCTIAVPIPPDRILA